jgi:hypothetical protein
MSQVQIAPQGYPYGAPVLYGLGALTPAEEKRRREWLARSRSRRSVGRRPPRRGPYRAIHAQRATARAQAQEAAARPPAPPPTPEQIAHRAEMRRRSEEGLRRFFLGKRYATGSVTTLPSRPGVPTGRAPRGRIVQGRDPGVYAGGAVRKVEPSLQRFHQPKSEAERHAEFMRKIAPPIQEEAPVVSPAPAMPQIVPAIGPGLPPLTADVASQRARVESALRKLGI